VTQPLQSQDAAQPF